MNKSLGQASLITAIIPMKASLDDLHNLCNWFSQEGAALVHFVLVCDRPTNEIRDITRSLPLQFPWIRIDVLNGDFFGPGPARNAGMSLIDTAYVAFWDSDDTPNILPIITTLEHIDPGIEKIYVGSFVIKSTGYRSKVIRTSNLIQFARNPGLWRCLIPAKALPGNIFPKFLLGEDQVFLANIVASTQNIEFTENIFYSYAYGNYGQLTSTKDYSHLKFTESIIRAIDMRNSSPEVSNFIYNLSTKQVLTMLRSGNVKIKCVSILKLTKRIMIDRRRCINSIITMARVPSPERFNV